MTENLSRSDRSNVGLRALIAVCIIAFPALFFQLNNTLIAYIVSSYSDVDPSVVQNILTIPSLIAIFAPFVLSYAVQKFDKRILMALSTFCCFIVFLVFMIVGTNGPIMALIAGAAFGGVSQGCCTTLMTGLINDYLPPEKVASSIAIANAMLTLGSAFIGIVGGRIAAGNDGANWPRAYYVGLLIIPCIIAYFVLLPKQPVHETAVEETAQKQEKVKFAIPVRVLVSILIYTLSILCIYAFLFNASTYVITEHALGTSSEAGIANSLFMGIGLLVSFTYSFWQKLFRKSLAVAAYILLAIGLLLMALIHTSLIGIYAGALIMGIGFNLITPYVITHTMQNSPSGTGAGNVALLSALSGVAQYFALRILNFMGGLLGGGLTNTLLAAAIGQGICAVFGIFLYRESKAA